MKKCFEYLDLGFGYYLGFRISKLGFIPRFLKSIKHASDNIGFFVT